MAKYCTIIKDRGEGVRGGGGEGGGCVLRVTREVVTVHQASFRVGVLSRAYRRRVLLWYQSRQQYLTKGFTL